jgi:hypothetical protein
MGNEFLIGNLLEIVPLEGREAEESNVMAEVRK